MDQKIINLYDRFTHGGMNRREFLDRLAELAGSAAAGCRAAAALAERLRAGRHRSGQRPAPGDRAHRLRFAQGQDQRLPRTRQIQGQASGRARHPREPWAQSAPRGCRAPVRGRGLPRLRRRSAVAGRRHARQRGRGARAASEDEPGRRRRGAGLRRVLPQESRGVDRQGRGGRLLLRRPDDQPAGGIEPGARRRRRLLRAAGAGGAGAQHQGGAHAALCRERRGRECRYRGLRGGAEGQQQEIHPAHVSRRPACLQQRHRAAPATTRRRPISPGAGRSPSSRRTWAHRRRRREPKLGFKRQSRPRAHRSARGCHIFRINARLRSRRRAAPARSRRSEGRAH